MSEVEKAPKQMVHTCHHCGHVFEIVRHQTKIENNRLVRVDGTATNMIYMATMNREYAKCPSCKAVEHQFSAEARDMVEDAGEEQDGGPHDSP